MSKTAKRLAYICFAICLIPTPTAFATTSSALFRNNNEDLIKSRRAIIERQVETIEADVEKKVLMPHGQVIEDNVRLRTEPDYESETKRLLQRGMVFDIKAKHEKFLEISFNGETGFIDVSLIEQYEEEPPYELYVEPIVTEEEVQEVEVGQVDGVPHFNPYNLRELSNLSENQIYRMLEGSALQTLSRAYYYYEKQYNVNAIFLMALNSEESGHGRSALAINNNNLGGVKNGDQGWAYFSDWGESLEYIANLIDKYYLSEDGLYYNGPSIWNVNTKYCEGYQWSENLISIANDLINKL